MSSYNPNVALQSEDQATNIGLRYIQTIQEASAIAGNIIYWTQEKYNHEVSLFINSDKETVVIQFDNEDWEDIEISLSDYKFLIGSFDVS